MKMTKKQRDKQEREYAEEMDAINTQQKRQDAERDADARAYLAKRYRTYNGLFVDAYGDPVIHVPDYD